MPSQPLPIRLVAVLPFALAACVGRSSAAPPVTVVVAADAPVELEADGDAVIEGDGPWGAPGMQLADAPPEARIAMAQAIAERARAQADCEAERA